jgi:hypothetical protein
MMLTFLISVFSAILQDFFLLVVTILHC